jgi:hypothetical protein
MHCGVRRWDLGNIPGEFLLQCLFELSYARWLPSGSRLYDFDRPFTIIGCTHLAKRDTRFVDLEEVLEKLHDLQGLRSDKERQHPRCERNEPTTTLRVTAAIARLRDESAQIVAARAGDAYARLVS